jgi:hypothetical protein
LLGDDVPNATVAFARPIVFGANVTSRSWQAVLERRTPATIGTKVARRRADAR